MGTPRQATVLCAVALLLAAHRAPAAQLQFLPDGVLLVDGDRFELSVDDPAGEMRALSAAAAGGELDDALTRTLGEKLLGPAAERLGRHERWIVTPPAMAGLAALRMPGSDGRVVEEREIVYRYDLQARHERPAASGGVLVVAPLVEGYDDLLDMPDTLLWELREVERHVELVPRNDSGPESVAAALGDRTPGLAWLRALPEQAASLAPVLLASAPLILWTHPEQPVDPEIVLPTAKSWVVPGRSVVADLWNRSEGRAAPYWERFFDELSAGADVATALARARRQAAADGSPELWVGWIALGDDQLRMDFEAPSAWRRWLDKLR